MAASVRHLGIWISPLGGYGGDEERTAWARKMGLIPPTAQLDLAQPATSNGSRTAACSSCARTA